VLLIINGKITRQIKDDEIAFSIYINGKFPDNPIAWTNELALELAEYIPIKPIELLEIVEKHLKKVGRLNEYFTTKRQYDDVKLTNLFNKAFQNLLEELKSLKLINNIKIKHVKVNPSLYPYNQVKNNIVLCEVPILLFEFEIKQ